MSQNNELLPLPEPAAFCDFGTLNMLMNLKVHSDGVQELFTADQMQAYARAAIAAQAAQAVRQSEPLAWLNPYGGVLTTRVTGHEKEHFTIPLFDHPAPVRQPLSDDNIAAIGHRMASTYTHRSDPTSHAYGFVRHTLIAFARAIEAAHGITAQ